MIGYDHDPSSEQCGGGAPHAARTLASTSPHWLAESSCPRANDGIPQQQYMAALALRCQLADAGANRGDKHHFLLQPVSCSRGRQIDQRHNWQRQPAAGAEAPSARIGSCAPSQPRARTRARADDRVAVPVHETTYRTQLSRAKAHRTKADAGTRRFATRARRSHAASAIVCNVARTQVSSDAQGEDASIRTYCRFTVSSSRRGEAASYGTPLCARAFYVLCRRYSDRRCNQIADILADTGLYTPVGTLDESRGTFRTALCA
ncbi:hypothetical protein BC834DRAFT_239317 [Gloeopeniophorella convolvens]|nr:hypothetical protein BC834DRAFT_239317 [Gloeopeniophorella convolvens]